MAVAKKSTLNVDGVPVPVSNPQKVLYPKVGFTKGDVIDYYVRVSPVMLPHLKARAVTLKRYPEGVEGFFFYEKQCPSHRPDWIKTTDVDRSDGTEINYCMVNSLPALVWTANLANLEFHAFLHKAAAKPRPAVLAFDLDPGPPADIIQCCQVGLWVRDMFSAMGLQSFAKTSGSKGLQVYVPLNTATTYEKTKPFAHEVATVLETRFPELVVSKMRKNLRAGKVLVDWSQNDDHKTTVNVYSLRAKDRPTVSTPVTWEEVEAALKKKKGELLVFESHQVLERVEKLGDLFEPVLTLKQKLPVLKAVALALAE